MSAGKCPVCPYSIDWWYDLILFPLLKFIFYKNSADNKLENLFVILFIITRLSTWNLLAFFFTNFFTAAGLNRFQFCSKNWDLRHTEDISSAAVRVPETLATSSYAGELILWRLETGQPYKKFDVSNPSARIKIHFQLQKEKEKPVKEEYIHHKRKSMAVVSIYKDLKDKKFSFQRNTLE